MRQFSHAPMRRAPPAPLRSQQSPRATIAHSWPGSTLRTFHPRYLQGLRTFTMGVWPNPQGFLPLRLGVCVEFEGERQSGQKLLNGSPEQRFWVSSYPRKAVILGKHFTWMGNIHTYLALYVCTDPLITPGQHGHIVLFLGRFPNERNTLKCCLGRPRLAHACMSCN